MPPIIGSAHRQTAFTLFSTLWAVHVLFHYSSYASFFVSPLGLAACISSVVLLLRPSSPLRLAASGFFYILAWFAHVPNSPNHEMLGAFVALTFTSSLIYERLRKGPSFSASVALDRVAPVLRSIVLLMYFWATFHKLNHDFLLDARVSCGSVFYNSFLDRLPFLPAAGGALNLVLAWATVVVEAAIGVLLLLPKTRKWGFALAWSFHLMLTLSPKSGFYNFTSLLFALFVFFAPATLPARLAEVWRESRVRALATRLMAPDLWRAVPGVLAGTAVVVLALFLVPRHSIGDLGQGLFDYFWSHHLWLRNEVFKVWMLWSLPLSYFVWRAFRRCRGDRPDAPGRIADVPRPMWLLTMLFFLWGATPYLGLKTENSLAMFSNLRTEATPNHFLVPEWTRVFGYQEDVVQVVSIAGRKADGGRLPAKLTRRRGYSIPYEGLRGWIRTQLRYGAHIEEVSYRRDGELIVERFDDGGEIFQQGFLAHKFLQFRSFKTKGPMTCEH